jgi:hypothetical protein
MNILQGMTWPLGTKLGQDQNGISMRFDSHGFERGDIITYDFRNGESFQVRKVLGDWVTCVWVTTDYKRSLPDGALVIGMKFLNMGTF